MDGHYSPLESYDIMIWGHDLCTYLLCTFTKFRQYDKKNLNKCAHGCPQIICVWSNVINFGTKV